MHNSVAQDASRKRTPEAVTLDSNILIAYLVGERRVIDILTGWKREGRVLLTSAISVAEVLALSALDSEAVERIRLFLRGFVSIPFDDELAVTAGALARRYGLKLADAAIAATALTRQVPLVTRDEHFQRVRKIVVVAI
jgi:hypothetical protein